MIAPPPPARRLATCDTECFSTYWLIKFLDVESCEFLEFESFPGQPLDVAGVVRTLQTYTVIGFNSLKYDLPMIAAALQGYDNASLKFASDAIILRNLQPWQFEREFNVTVPAYIDHIDLIEVSPGIASLKIYGGRLHSRRMQDLPIEPSASISPSDRALLRDYCANDLLVTLDLYRKFEKQIKLRADMSKEYGVDLRSKSDAQIAESVIKAQIGFVVQRPTIPIGTQFLYKRPEFISFQTDAMREIVAMIDASPFIINDKESLVMSPELAAAKIAIGTSVYKLGMGGLHSTESGAFHLADDDYVLADFDVASYYPAIILRLGLYPAQMGDAFLRVYKSIVDKRLAAKAAGDKKTADMLKITINGTFGKLGSKWSILYAPDLMVQTTITGQLALLMLIEMLELCGIAVVSANTDGVVLKTRRHMIETRDAVVKWWESVTGFDTEAAQYRALYSRDVNNYCAFKLDGEAKLKGAYAPPEPIGGSWPNPTNEVCIDAVIAYLRDGVPVEQTIRACRDVRQFVTIRTVKGGGVKYWGQEVAAASTVGGKKEQLAARGFVEAVKGQWSRNGSTPVAIDLAHRIAVDELREAYPIVKEFLGKAIRWYYAHGETGTINYATNGNLVPKTEGARPLMELPDTLPDDIDYAWYEREARDILNDMGIFK